MHRGLLLTLTLTGLGCATTEDVTSPEIASPFSKELHPSIGTNIDEQIESSLPTVSYSVETSDSDAAAALDPLDPNAVRDLIWRLESLDGDGVIVCVPTGDTAFGKCVFPLPEDEP